MVVSNQAMYLWGRALAQAHWSQRQPAAVMPVSYVSAHRKGLMSMRLTEQQLKAANVPKTTCMRCRKLVDHQQIQYDTDSRRYMIIVRCHGEWERNWVAENDFETGYIYEGQAFMPLNPQIIEGEFTVVTDGTEDKPPEEPKNLPVVWKPDLDPEGIKLIECCNGSKRSEEPVTKSFNQPSTERQHVSQWAPLMREAI